MIRSCARPAFASENLRWNGQWLNYRLPKTCHTGKTFITLDPIDFIDKIAALIPPARRHRHHYHGAFAPNLPLRRAMTKVANFPIEKFKISRLSSIINHFSSHKHLVGRDSSQFQIFSPGEKI